MHKYEKRVKISIIGFGAVGQGVATVVKDIPFIEVTAIADSKGVAITPDIEEVLNRKRAGLPISNSNLSAIDVIMGVDHDITVEVTPTNIIDGEPGLMYIREALKHSRHVVTSNKGPLVKRFNELMKLARDYKVMLRYEATVGGAMPMINLVREALTGSKVRNIVGVFNGTCNYILTRMTEEGLDYDHVLSEAQDMGIAEADPTYDVMGIDTASKVVILANSVFKQNVTLEDVDVTGIIKITADALRLAKERSCSVKLIGDVKGLKVSPMMVPVGHPLSVGGTLNAASIMTDNAGEITVTGKGAGSIETASAILGDIISIYKELEGVDDVHC
ncbi:MAG TPA: homoserine dehydrogenase [Candidatus Acidoferrales bacterium]|nr:homoserine dehydrogenase [Candidatus Acidoferrales bacterium]